MSLENATLQSLTEISKIEEVKIEKAQGLKKPDQHGFVDLVRHFLKEGKVEHEPISFEDIKPYI